MSLLWSSVKTGFFSDGFTRADCKVSIASASCCVACCFRNQNAVHKYTTRPSHCSSKLLALGVIPLVLPWVLLLLLRDLGRLLLLLLGPLDQETDNDNCKRSL